MPSGKPGMTGGPGGEAPASSLLLASASQPPTAPPAARGSLVEVTVPVYNEEKVLAASVRRLHSYLTGKLALSFRHHHCR